MRNPGDIFTEPSNIDVNTLKNLGPLTEMAGIWEGSRSLDIPPKPLSAWPLGTLPQTLPVSSYPPSAE